MNDFIAALVEFGSGLLPWVSVMPWEQGVRVRFGKYVKTLEAGWHLRIPLVDQTAILPTRRQFTSIPLLDVMTRDRINLSVGLTAIFRITDVPALLNSVSQPEDAVSELVASTVARYIRQSDLADINQDKLEKAASEGLRRNIDGIGEIRIAVTTYVAARTYRLIVESERTDFGELIQANQK